MFLSYCLYGLETRVNLALPGLTVKSVSSKVDLEICLGQLPSWLPEIGPDNPPWFITDSKDENGDPALTIWQVGKDGCFLLQYSDGTAFVIDRSGSRIWTTWPDTLTLEDTSTYLLGPVMGFALILRGTFSLHASAIAVNGRAIALVGVAGAGKSTTAAAFARLGYPVLTEDVTALGDQGNTFIVQPGYPLIRLWPESVKILYGSNDALPLLTPNWDKRYLALNGDEVQFHSQPIPLAAIYLFGQRRNEPAAPFIEDIPAKESLLHLIKHTYAASLMNKDMMGREFNMLQRLLSNVPMRRVRAHADPSQLPKLCQIILEDFHANATEAKIKADPNVL